MLLLEISYLCVFRTIYNNRYSEKEIEIGFLKT